MFDVTRVRKWSEHLDSFHAHRPGITEDVLGRCADGNGSDPYQWLTDGLDPDARVVDLACGSGPTRALVSDSWVGIDRSTAELVRAQQRGRVTLIRGDVIRVPIRDATVDAVLCSMALMLIDPCFMVLDEIHRILTPSGELRVMLPTTSPLTMSDRWKYLRLFAVTRSFPRFPPTPLRRNAENTFAASGLIIISDESKRFGCPISTSADAERFVESWYRPDRRPSEAEPPRPRRGLDSPTIIGVPLRRIIAYTTARSN